MEGPNPQRFQVYEEDPSGKGFYLPTGEFFATDQYNGWFDERGYYYSAEGQPCNPPYPVNPSMFQNNQHNNPNIGQLVMQNQAPKKNVNKGFGYNNGSGGINNYNNQNYNAPKKYSHDFDPILDMYGTDNDDRYNSHDQKIAKEQEKEQKAF